MSSNTLRRSALYALAFGGQQTAFLSAEVALTIVVGSGPCVVGIAAA